MRDIPLFTTSSGVASLFLKKIPFTKEAYVHIRDSQTCGELVKECIDVCRMAGAERVYGTGHHDLADAPLLCSVLRFSVCKKRLPETDAIALPVVSEQTDWWRRLYNQKMVHVPTAAPLSITETGELVKEGKAFCIFRSCSLLGIGVAHDGQILAVASVLPGAGRDVVLALANVLETPTVSLSVASTNKKAIRLYRSLEFAETQTEATWYQIF